MIDFFTAHQHIQAISAKKRYDKESLDYDCIILLPFFFPEHRAIAFSTPSHDQLNDQQEACTDLGCGRIEKFMFECYFTLYTFCLYY